MRGVPYNQAGLYTSILANDLSTGAVKFNTTITGPSPLASLETYNGTLLGVFRSGEVAQIDPATGKLSVLFNLLPNGTGTRTRYVTSSVTVDQVNGRIFAVTRRATVTRAWELASLDLHTGAVASAPLGKPSPTFFWEISRVVEAVYIPTIDRVVLFVTGLFDALVYIEPVGGAAYFAVSDFARVGSGYRFRNSNVTFDSDVWRNANYDPVTSYLYFDITALPSASPDQLVHLEFPKGQSPTHTFTYVWGDSQLIYGLTGMKFVRCVGPCQSPGK
jgi:hypothetical protein